MSVMTPIVSALTESLLAGSLGGQVSPDEKSVERTAALLVRKVELMPRQLGIPMAILTMVFDFCGIFAGGRRFREQSLSTRNKQILQWKESSFGICRDFIRFYEKMTAFIYYSELNPSRYS